jgi:opacity protein-like surface antigen
VGLFVFLSDILLMGLSVSAVQAADVDRNVSPFASPFGGTAAEIGGSRRGEIVQADVGRTVSPSFRFI